MNEFDEGGEVKNPQYLCGCGLLATLHRDYVLPKEEVERFLSLAKPTEYNINITIESKRSDIDLDNLSHKIIESIKRRSAHRGGSNF